MQPNQPVYGYNGVPNYGQLPSYLPQYNPFPPNPTVVGEGDVLSVLLPDGSLQFYFYPTSVGYRALNYSYPPLNDPGVWFIRNVCRPTSACNQNYGKDGVLNFLGQNYNSEYKYNAAPGYHVKFHNDNVTSTTDLHYFFPCLRLPSPTPNKSEAIQASALTFDDSRSCRCMSHSNLDKSRPSHKSSTESCVDCDCNTNKAKKESRKKKKIPKCKCRPTRLDKSVTTYNDKSIGCTAADACEGNDCSCKLGLWLPKTSETKKAMCTTTSLSSLCKSDCSCERHSDR